MPKVTLLKQDGTQAGDIELNESVFGIEPNNHVIHEALVAQRSSHRQGTHNVKNRSEVRGGGRKPWRQKGTGQARHGSIRSPIWVGGGVAFGPTQERNYKIRLPRKIRRLALRSALSAKVASDSVIVVDDLSLDAPKTKDFVSVLNALNVDEKALVVTSEKNKNIMLSANNLQTVKVITVEEVNVLDIIAHDTLIITKDAAEKAGEVFA